MHAYRWRWHCLVAQLAQDLVLHVHPGRAIWGISVPVRLMHLHTLRALLPRTAVAVLPHLWAHASERPARVLRPRFLQGAGCDLPFASRRWSRVGRSQFRGVVQRGRPRARSGVPGIAVKGLRLLLSQTHMADLDSDSFV